MPNYQKDFIYLSSFITYMDKFLIDKTTLKALVVDTRMNILKLLLDKRYTQSEIADILGLKKPTVKEHVDILEKAKLIKKEETKRKWKYYNLTFKGRMVVQPREVKVFFAFILTLVAALVSMFSYFRPSPNLENDMVMSGARMMKAEVAEMAVVAEPVMAVSNATSFDYRIIVIIGLVAISMFLFGYILKKKIIIIGGKK